MTFCIVRGVISGHKFNQRFFFNWITAWEFPAVGRLDKEICRIDWLAQLKHSRRVWMRIYDESRFDRLCFGLNGTKNTEEEEETKRHLLRFILFYFLFYFILFYFYSVCRLEREHFQVGMFFFLFLFCVASIPICRFWFVGLVPISGWWAARVS